MASGVKKSKSSKWSDQIKKTYKPSHKTPNGQIFPGVLLSPPVSQYLPIQLRAVLICRWGPSCWSPLLKRATPPLVGHTAMVHSNRSDREDQEAQERREHRERHGVPSLLHGRLCHKPVGQDHLKVKSHRITESLLNFWQLAPLNIENMKHEFLFLNKTLS